MHQHNHERDCRNDGFICPNQHLPVLILERQEVPADIVHLFAEALPRETLGKAQTAQRQQRAGRHRVQQGQRLLLRQFRIQRNRAHAAEDAAIERITALPELPEERAAAQINHDVRIPGKHIQHACAHQRAKAANRADCRAGVQREALARVQQRQHQTAQDADGSGQAVFRQEEDVGIPIINLF